MARPSLFLLALLVPLAASAERLTIRSSPSGLLVFVDRMAQGRTPASVELSPGEHLVTLASSACFESLSQSVSLAPGESIAIELSPAESKSEIFLSWSDDTPLEGRIVVDGREYGEGPGPVSIPACSRNIDVFTSDGRRWSEALSLRAGGQYDLRTSLSAPLAEPRPLAPPAPLAELERRCVGGDGPACHAHAGLLWSSEPVKASQYLSFACDLEVLPACTELARVLEQSDPERARTLYQKACRGGEELGCLLESQLPRPRRDALHLHPALSAGLNFTRSEPELALALGIYGELTGAWLLWTRLGTERVGLDDSKGSEREISLSASLHRRLGPLGVGAGAGLSHGLEGSGLSASAELGLLLDLPFESIHASLGAHWRFLSGERSGGAGIQLIIGLEALRLGD